MYSLFVNVPSPRSPLQIVSDEDVPDALGARFAPMDEQHTMCSDALSLKQQLDDSSEGLGRAHANARGLPDLTQVALAVPTNDVSGLKKWLGLFLNETGLTDDEVDDFATTGGVCAFHTTCLALETSVNGTVHLAPLTITSVDYRVANGSNVSGATPSRASSR